jgi:hypothetical protein
MTVNPKTGKVVNTKVTYVEVATDPTNSRHHRGNKARRHLVNDHFDREVGEWYKLLKKPRLFADIPRQFAMELIARGLCQRVSVHGKVWVVRKDFMDKIGFNGGVFTTASNESKSEDTIKAAIFALRDLVTSEGSIAVGRLPKRFTSVVINRAVNQGLIEMYEKLNGARFLTAK